MVQTILVDREEKIPLLFPEYLALWDPSSSATRSTTTRVPLRVETCVLRTGDYQLGAAPSGLVVERKRSLGELAGNLARARGRTLFLDELSRIRDNFGRGILLVEGDPLSLEEMGGPHYKGPPAHEIRDLLFDSLAGYPIDLWMVRMDTRERRRAAGSWVAAALIQHAWRNPSSRTGREGSRHERYRLQEPSLPAPGDCLGEPAGSVVLAGSGPQHELGAGHG